MNKKAVAVTLSVLFTANLQAASLFTYTPQAKSIGLYLGGQIWQNEASGLFGEKNALIDFKLKKEQQSNYFLAVEHPLPLLPNIRISSSTFATADTDNSTQASNFDDETSHVNLQVNFTVDASFNVSYVDYTLYYQVFDNRLFSLDLGLTARDFDGAFTLTGTTNTITTRRDFIWDGEEHDDHDYHAVTETKNTVTNDQIKTNEIEPMLYVATNINLPLKGLNAFAQGDVLLTDNRSLYNYQVGLSYELVDNVLVNLNLTLGYRADKMEFEGLNNLYTNLEYKGAFVGVIAHF